MAVNNLRGRFRMNDARLEQRSLELEHAGDFDLTDAPAVNWAGGRRHRLLSLTALPEAIQSMASPNR